MSLQILRDYPVSQQMQDLVKEKLTEIEQTHQIKILFACESGSRGWGFASPDSDYDVRFIYVHQPNWYVQIDTPRDVIEIPISAELDISGWELRKTLGQLKKSNPVIAEWLDSPVIYYADTEFLAYMAKLMPLYFSAYKSAYHYRSMAFKNYHTFVKDKTEVRFKKYFYILRPLFALKYIETFQSLPPMKFADLVEAVLPQNDAFYQELNQVLSQKTGVTEAKVIPQQPHILKFIEQNLTELTDKKFYSEPYHDNTLLDECLQHFVFNTQNI